MFSNSTKKSAPEQHASLLSALENQGHATNDKLQGFMTAIKSHRYRFALQQLFALEGDYFNLIELLMQYHPDLDFKLNQLSQTRKSVLSCLNRSSLNEAYKKKLIILLEKHGAKYSSEIPIFIPYPADLNSSFKYVDVDKTLPKKIHVLWLGSDLSENKLERLHKLAARCHEKEFELNLWLEDEAQFLRPLSLVEMSFPNIKIRLVNDLCESFKKYCTTDGYVALMNAMRREMVGSSNFATVSDFMRIMILILHGGIWLDMDVVVPSFIDTLEARSVKWDEERKIVAQNAEHPTRIKYLEKWCGIKAIQKLKLDGHHIYNTFVLFGMPKHITLFTILQRMIIKYWQFENGTFITNGMNAMDAKRLRPTSISMFEKDSSRRALTIELGPSLVMNYLNELSRSKGDEFTLTVGLHPHEMKVMEDGNYLGSYDAVYVPFFGLMDNYGEVSWDVRPPSSFESGMKSKLVPF